jgi:hypothetical protein
VKSVIYYGCVSCRFKVELVLAVRGQHYSSFFEERRLGTRVFSGLSMSWSIDCVDKFAIFKLVALSTEYSVVNLL